MRRVQWAHMLGMRLAKPYASPFRTRLRRTGLLDIISCSTMCFSNLAPLTDSEELLRVPRCKMNAKQIHATSVDQVINTFRLL